MLQEFGTVSYCVGQDFDPSAGPCVQEQSVEPFGTCFSLAGGPFDKTVASFATSACTGCEREYHVSSDSPAHIRTDSRDLCTVQSSRAYPSSKSLFRGADSLYLVGTTTARSRCLSSPRMCLSGMEEVVTAWTDPAEWGSSADRCRRSAAPSCASLSRDVRAGAHGDES